MAHVKWPEIESLKHVRKTARKLEVTSVTYKAKVKIHGTNAGIRIKNGKVTAQSKSRDLNIQHDNSGFAMHVLKHENELLQLVCQPCVIFGEWCGPGIQSGTAINKLDDKILAVFSVLLLKDNDENNIRINDPEDIMSFFKTEVPSWMHIIPWHGDPIEIEFKNPEPAIEKLEAMLDEVEKCDPWVKETFGKEGIGEGLVLYPFKNSFSRFAFKIKGEKHKVKSTKQRIEIAPEILASADAFAETFVTPARLEQCLAETGIEEKIPQNIGRALRWMNNDIIKESKEELIESGLTWKQVSSAISRKVREFFLE